MSVEIYIPTVTVVQFLIVYFHEGKLTVTDFHLKVCRRSSLYPAAVHYAVVSS